MGQHVRLFHILCLTVSLSFLGCQSGAGRRIARNPTPKRFAESPGARGPAGTSRSGTERQAAVVQVDADTAAPPPSLPAGLQRSAKSADAPQESVAPAGHSVDLAVEARPGALQQSEGDTTRPNGSRPSQGGPAWWGRGAASADSQRAGETRQREGRPRLETQEAGPAEAPADSENETPGLAQRTADAVSDTVGMFIGSDGGARGRILGVRESEQPPQSPDQELASVSDHHLSDEVWEEHVLTLIDMLGAEVSGGLSEDADARQRSEYVSQQVRLRLLYLIAGDPARAYEAIPGITAVEQEFWQHTFFSLWKLLEQRKRDGLSESERAAEALSYLNRAAQKLGAVAPLTIRTMAFCSEIESFGAYRVIPDSRFPAGERVLIYAEIENFASEPLLASNGKYQTKLRSTLEIFPVSARPRNSDPQLAAVAREELPTTVDLCARQRRDYFNAYTYTLPEDLQPGYYKLQVTIVDELSGSVATESVPFEIAR